MHQLAMVGSFCVCVAGACILEVAVKSYCQQPPAFAFRKLCCLTYGPRVAARYAVRTTQHALQ